MMVYMDVYTVALLTGFFFVENGSIPNLLSFLNPVKDGVSVDMKIGWIAVELMEPGPDDEICLPDEAVNMHLTEVLDWIRLRRQGLGSNKLKVNNNTLALACMQATAEVSNMGSSIIKEDTGCALLAIWCSENFVTFLALAESESACLGRMPMLAHVWSPSHLICWTMTAFSRTLLTVPSARVRMVAKK